MLLVTSVTYNLYKKSEKELNSRYKRAILFEKKAEEIKTLKKKYSTNALKQVKRICKITPINESYQIDCNITQNNLYKISLFLKSNIKLKSFSIKEEGKFFIFKAEILK